MNNIKLAKSISCSTLLIAFCVLFSACKNEANKDGARLYNEKCLNCHQESGQGVGKLIPALSDTEFLKANRKKLACFIQDGTDEVITINGAEYREKMEGIEDLSDADIVNILNYVGKNWGNDLETFTIAEVQKTRQNCK